MTSTGSPTCTTGSSYYRVYSGTVLNYYYDGSAYTSRTLYHNGVYGSNANYTMYLATTDTGLSNYTTASGPGSSVWAGLSTAADTIPEYTNVGTYNTGAAYSSATHLYTVYQFNVNYSAGANVDSIGSNSGNCKVSATDASAGGTSCTVTLPSITPDTGYVSVGWNTTSGATTGTASGQSYTISSNPTTLYANAVDVWAENVSYDDTNTGLGCTDTQCALDELSLMLNPSLLNNETCPGPRCVYSKASGNVIGSTITGSHGITGDNNTDYFDNYNSFTENVFLAHVLAGNTIVSSFVCGIENNLVYCLRGGVEEDSPHPIYTYNVNQVNTAIPTCNAVDTGYNVSCNGTNTSTYFYITGVVDTSDDAGIWGCSIWDDGSSHCS